MHETIHPVANPAFSSGAAPLIGMHGERTIWIEQATLLYPLGHGARSYNPTLQCFLSRDPYSPFSTGGLNPYAFCGGDPVNRTDHSGYMSVEAGIGLGLGILGFILGLLSFGLLSLITLSGLAAGLAMTSTSLGLLSSGIGIAASLLEDHDPELARTLGWASMGFGLASLITGLIGPSIILCLKHSGRLLIGKLPRPSHAHVIHDAQTPGLNIDFRFTLRFRGGRLATTHGSPGRLQSRHGYYLSPDDWADELAQLPGYSDDLPTGKRHLYLLSCNAATPTPLGPNAGRVATRLNMDVSAFNSPTTVATLTPAVQPGLPSLLFSHGSTWGKLTRFKP